MGSAVHIKVLPYTVGVGFMECCAPIWLIFLTEEKFYEKVKFNPISISISNTTSIN